MSPTNGIERARDAEMEANGWTTDTPTATECLWRASRRDRRLAGRTLTPVFTAERTEGVA